jgi:alanyl-tRNA synthetase
MRATEIRSRFLDFFERNGHAVRPSASLVPVDDPTLLFVNAGMVPFKRIFLGLEEPEFGRRATTAQKSVRAGGKHNDLEQVGHTARHHTFFEMLGNFSFGDYFKRDAIAFAWEFVTRELRIDPRHLRVTVYHEDHEARALWREIAGIAESRIYGLGERDNFWQMADTGPCGPCSEIYVDLAHVAKDWAFPEGASGEWTDLQRTDFSLDAFVEGAEAGRFLEIWNLVFMQYDRQADGHLKPLPRPSVDTGAGLERIAAVLQGKTNNFHTDVFAPLLERVGSVMGVPYTEAPDPASYRVIADHARAVAFLMADGVFPSNDGRGYVLRRILRRAVRHAWLLGQRKPTLVHVVETVIDTMGDAYPELRQRRAHIVDTTRSEEERFLSTIGAGMQRFDELAPKASTQGSTAVRGTISGEDAFRLYDTFGFPIDLTELMARERGYTIDIAGFERALGEQRTQSKEERKTKKVAASADELGDLATWERPGSDTGGGRFVGYDVIEIETQVAAVRKLGGDRVAVMLEESPFYAESGGQISDAGEIIGDGWRVDVDDVKKINGRVAAIGVLDGPIAFGAAMARVPTAQRRDTERNHTATHLLHAALREVLGDHVHQAGSLVAPDRLRFDFSHHGPVRPEQLVEIEERVNRAIWAGVDLRFEEKPYRQAVAEGAMALFGEKYGDVVRVVSIPGLSVELCGGTHVRNTSEIGLFKITSETGVAANQRRIEAVTAHGAYEAFRERERALAAVADIVKAPLDAVPKRVRALVDERKALEKRLDEAHRGSGGGDRVTQLLAGAATIGGARVIAATVPVSDVREMQTLGDALRERLESGVAVLAASLADGKHTLLVVVTDDLRERGVRADEIVRSLAAIAGGRGGGKPHMAQAGIADPARFPDILAQVPVTVAPLLEGVPK